MTTSYLQWQLEINQQVELRDNAEDDEKTDKKIENNKKKRRKEEKNLYCLRGYKKDTILLFAWKKNALKK